MRGLLHLALAAALFCSVLMAPAADPKAPDPKAPGSKAPDPKGTETKEGSVRIITDVGGKNLDEWLEETNPKKNPDPYVRESAVRAIAAFGKDGQKALPTLVARLSDPDASVAANAIAAIRAVGLDPKDQATYQSAVSGLSRTVERGASVARVQAAMVLAEQGPEARSAASVLIKDTIKNPVSWELRRTGVYALGRLGLDPKGPDSTVVKALVNVMKDDVCAQVRLQAIMSLGGMGHPRQVDQLTVKHGLEHVTKYDRDPSVVLWARLLMAKFDPKPESPTVRAQVDYLAIQLAKSTDPQVRAQAAQALGILGAPAKPKVADLVEAVKDKDASVAAAAAAALGQLKEQITEANVEALAQALNDPGASPQVRGQAAHALGVIGTRTKIGDLIALLQDKDPVVAGAAFAALTQLKDLLVEKHLATLGQLLTTKDLGTEVRCRAAQLLGLAGPAAKTQLQALVEALNARESSVVSCAVVALAQLGKDADPALPALTKLKQHEDVSIREAAAGAIEEINTRRKK